MFWVILVATALFIALLDTTVLASNLQYHFFRTKPDLFLLVTVLCALRLEPVRGSFVGLTMGLTRDLFSQEPLGLHSSFFTGIAIMIGLLKDKFYKNHLLAQLLVLLIASVTHKGGCALILWLSYQPIDPSSLLWGVFIGTLLTLAIAPGVYFILKKLLPVTRWGDVSKKA